MTLKELQKMIKEEFSHFVKEQGPGMPPPGMPTPPPPPGMPGIEVGDGDIDAMESPAGGPEGAEAQLQKIFGMLKAYFEGGEEGMEPEIGDEEEVDIDADVDADAEAGAPEDMVEPVEDEEEAPMEEAYGEKTGGNAASNSGKYGGAYGATGEDKGNAQLHEGFKSRLQKLANIRK